MQLVFLASNPIIIYGEQIFYDRAAAGLGLLTKCMLSELSHPGPHQKLMYVCAGNSIMKNKLTSQELEEIGITFLEVNENMLLGRKTSSSNFSCYINTLYFAINLTEMNNKTAKLFPF